MKVPAPVLQIIYKLAANNIGSILAAPLEKVPHINVVAMAYQNGEPLEVIIGLYLQATESLKDDEIAGRVGEVLQFIEVEVPKILATISDAPFKDALSKMLGGLSIPDFDDKAGNEVKIIDVINKAMSELAD